MSGVGLLNKRTMNKLVVLKLVRDARDALASGRDTRYVMEKINDIEDYLAEPEAETMEELFEEHEKHQEMNVLFQQRFLDRVKRLREKITKDV